MLNCSFSIANLALKSDVFKFNMLNAKFNMLNEPAPLVDEGRRKWRKANEAIECVANRHIVSRNWVWPECQMGTV